MFGTKRKSKPAWAVMCKACGRPFATGLMHEAAEDLPSSADYQCTFCGMTETYSRSEHAPAA